MLWFPPLRGSGSRAIDYCFRGGLGVWPCHTHEVGAGLRGCAVEPGAVLSRPISDSRVAVLCVAEFSVVRRQSILAHFACFLTLLLARRSWQALRPHVRQVPEGFALRLHFGTAPHHRALMCTEIDDQAWRFRLADAQYPRPDMTNRLQESCGKSIVGPWHEFGVCCRFALTFPILVGSFIRFGIHGSLLAKLPSLGDSVGNQSWVMFPLH